MLCAGRIPIQNHSQGEVYNRASNWSRVVDQAKSAHAIIRSSESI